MATDPPRSEDGSPRTGDLELVQVLAETRRLAGRRADDEGDTDAGRRWRTLGDRVGTLLGDIGTGGGEPGHPPAIGFDRIDRSAIALDATTTDGLASSLRALHDRPDAARLDAAERALTRVEDARA
jgi:hypothetical protein